MDEPFQGVDATTERAIVDLLKELSAANKTVVVVHHDLQTVPEYFDWVTLLNVRAIASGPSPASSPRRTCGRPTAAASPSWTPTRPDPQRRPHGTRSGFGDP
jgi:ABC-type Mn2+/Zn2+ transport system ATPase subunit